MSRIANRPLTKPRDPHRFVDLAQAVAATLLLILPAFLYASQRANLHDARSRIGQLERELLQLQQTRDLLKVQLETERDPRRLRQKGHDLAGLEDPRSEQVVLLPRPEDSVFNAWVAVGLESDGHP